MAKFISDITRIANQVELEDLCNTPLSLQAQGIFQTGVFHQCSLLFTTSDNYKNIKNI